MPAFFTPIRPWPTPERFTGTFCGQMRKMWKIHARDLARRAGTTAYDIKRFETGVYRSHSVFLRNSLCTALRLTVLDAAHDTIRVLNADPGEASSK